MKADQGALHSNYTINYTPWGLDNEIPIGASIPARCPPESRCVNTARTIGIRPANVRTVCSNC